MYSVLKPTGFPEGKSFNFALLLVCALAVLLFIVFACLSIHILNMLRPYEHAYGLLPVTVRMKPRNARHVSFDI
ncbi:hypothetical protein QR680_015758 [Steinernema hermaphroditum]|uniref:Uncharacterized protein n=1 Tax=Steinernema hermaphroditum TaxID=289476 RepID=A0AA39H8V2_9BILA|nr:hypothetical protein QR680_015758 [Steinernema hermaphroditum]